MRHSAHVDWTTSDHTAVDIPITAMGAGASNFTGIYENTDVFKKLVQTLGFRIKK
ncbi:alkaline phosphatase [Cohnella soli]|uniref:Alkaline phosphatase n=1 Tax=Cohnella soli TaxID=425005 RepID=A0ABW0I0K6_9BACL